MFRQRNSFFFCRVVINEKNEDPNSLTPTTYNCNDEECQWAWVLILAMMALIGHPPSFPSGYVDLKLDYVYFVHVGQNQTVENQMNTLLFNIWLDKANIV